MTRLLSIPAHPTLVSLKAYGDFVIACGAVRGVHVGTSTPVDIVAGAHLRRLAEALGAPGVHFIEGDSTDDVPAAFDLRKRGWTAALLSLLRLRGQIAALPNPGCLVFDRIGWRERFLAGTRERRSLPISDNIYRAYQAALGDVGNTSEKVPIANRTARSAVIVPVSRITAKTLPAATVDSLARQLSARKIAVEVVVLEGESVTLPLEMPTCRIPRRFDALIDHLRKFDLVISADSLPAHLAEYLELPCFVVGPRPNTYWLPVSCLRDGAWSLFGDETRLGAWLDRGRPVDVAAQ